MAAAKEGLISFKDAQHATEEGAGVLLVPGESARFEASGSDLELLHMVAPKPPAAVEEGLPGGPGYFFNRQTLRPLSDASGGRVRRFCAESTVRLLDGSRLTPTNAIQAGEMRYHEGGSSPYHAHVGTSANPDGAAHCYMTFKGRGVVEVGETTQELEPGTLVYFPPGVPHRLHAHGGPLDYFEIQAWRSFKTNVLSEEALGLKWYYEPETRMPRRWSGTRADETLSGNSGAVQGGQAGYPVRRRIYPFKPSLGRSQIDSNTARDAILLAIRSKEANAMRVTLLGTGTPTPSLVRMSSGYLLRIGNDVILLDHGPGAYHRMMEAGVAALDVSHVFFSHLHYDHCLDYARLLITRWDQGGHGIPELKVYGPRPICNACTIACSLKTGPLVPI